MRTLSLTLLTGVLVAGLTWTPVVEAEETRLTVRARAVDAKFIGDLTGGFNVVIEDADTGRVLDQGRISGGTGDTERLMRTPRERGMQLSTEDAAGFEARLEIDRPTRVNIELTGPFATRDGAGRFQQTRWVLPGRHVTGDGVVFEIPGLLVDPDVLVHANETIHVLAEVMLMCGCPITPGGLWDADEYEVKAQLISDGEVIRESDLEPGQDPSTFTGRVPVSAPGEFELRVVAFHPPSGNAGVGSMQVRHER